MTRPSGARDRRRALYVVAALPSALMLLVSLRTAVLLHQDGQGQAAYDAAAFPSARDDFADNRLLNPVERWVAPFNEGDARFRLRDYPGAVAAFGAALVVVPEVHECAVRLNLALSHEAVGDGVLAEGDRGGAEASWQRGLEALAGCSGAVGDPQAEASNTVEARLVQKLGDRPDPPDPPEVPPADEETLDKERRLEEQNEQAREKRRESEDRDGPPAPIPTW